MMRSFFEYVPTHLNATRHDWLVRDMIWQFKDGKYTLHVAELIAKAIRMQFGENARRMVLAPIPASTAEKNERRYANFAQLVTDLCGIQNGYDHITIEGDRLAIHETKSRKVLNNVQVIRFDKDFFEGKTVLVFDDILTLGYSYARFACAIEKLGANVIGAYFLGKTITRN
jgi:predicted amidophosphoribosyltransferase